MKFPLYYLDDLEFENLVASICEEILWTWTIIFSEWKDWWRDAKLHWKANYFPSTSRPRDWKIVIQAKHTTKLNASCSDSDFDTIVWKEIPKIIELKKEWDIDYYLMFTNRKLTGWKSDEIENRITNETTICSTIIWLERLLKFINDNPSIIRKHNLNKLFLPLEFYEDDLVEVVKVFSSTDFKSKEIIDDISNIEEKIKKIPIEEKNKLNSLSKDYFDDVLSKSYDFFSKIELFLKDPNNTKYKDMYEDTVSEIREIIVINRSDYWPFEEILYFLYKYVSSNCWYINKRRYINYFLHYMYYMCHIGKS